MASALGVLKVAAPEESPERPRGADGRFVRERLVQGEGEEAGRQRAEASTSRQRRRLQDAIPLEESHRLESWQARAGKRSRGPGRDDSRQIDDRRSDAQDEPLRDPIHVPRAGYFFEVVPLQHDMREGSGPDRPTYGHMPSGGSHAQRREYPPPRDYGPREGRDLQQDRWRHDRFPSQGTGPDGGHRAERRSFTERRQGESAGEDRWGSSEDTDRRGADRGRREEEKGGSEHRRGGSGEWRERGNGDGRSYGFERRDRGWGGRPAEAAERGPERFGPSPWMDTADPTFRQGSSGSEKRSWGGLQSHMDSRYRWGSTGGGGRDKWKHDMFEEVARSPSPRKDEADPIEQIEALLAS